MLQKMQFGSENHPLITKLRSMLICSGPQDGNTSHFPCRAIWHVLNYSIFSCNQPAQGRLWKWGVLLILCVSLPHLGLTLQLTCTSSRGGWDNTYILYINFLSSGDERSASYTVVNAINETHPEDYKASTLILLFPVTGNVAKPRLAIRCKEQWFCKQPQFLLSLLFCCLNKLSEWDVWVSPSHQANKLHQLYWPAKSLHRRSIPKHYGREENKSQNKMNLYFLNNA